MRKHRPQRAATDQMHMDVVNLLPAVTIAVHDEAIAIFRDAFLLCDFRRDGKKTPQRLLVFRRDVIDRWHQHVRNNQNVGRGLGRNIAKRSDKLILINNIGRDFTTNNFAENGFLRPWFFFLLG